MPHDVWGLILTKSSVARTFIVVEMAPWIHPACRGCLTLEIANVSNTPVLLYPGRTIAQLILMDTPRRNTKKLTGEYFDPILFEAASLDDPAEDLAKLGVREVARWKREIV